VDAATQRALSTDPAKRFPSIMAFADAVTQESTGAAAATRESRRWKRIAIVLPMIVAAAAAAWVIFFAGPPRVVISGAETIAVMPFTVTGAGMEGLGEGMVDLLAANLDGVGPIRAVEPRTVMREWRQRVRSGNGDLEDALAVGRSADAASVLTGSIVATGGNARLTAELYDLAGKQLARAQIDGPADSVLTLADGLALELLREIWRSREPLPSANASGINSASMPAIRAYLTGERYHRRGLWDSAQVAFEESVAADSTFALSWYKLASTMGWKGQYGSAASRQAAANAVRFSAALTPRMQSLFQAYSLFSQINPAAADSARLYVNRYPTDADGWFLLGESQYHGRTYQPLPPDVLREPFDKVLALDSSLTPAAIHPMELAIEQRDTVLLNRYEAVFRLAGSDDELNRLATARRALAGNDSAFSALFGNAIGAGVGLSVLRARLQAPGLDGDSVMTRAGRIAAAAPAGNIGIQMRAMEGLIAGALGRDSVAQAVAASFGSESGDLGSYVRLMSLVGGFADSTKLLEMKNSFAGAPANNPFVIFWTALIDYDLGNPRAAQARVRPVIAQAGDSVPRWLVGAMMTIDGLAMVALGDAVAGVARADAGLRQIGGFNAGGITVVVSLRYARLLVSRTQTRAEGIRRLQYGFGNNPEVHPITQYYLGKAFEASAMRDSAVEHYSDFIRLWNKAEPRHQHYVSDAKAAIERLTAETGAEPPPVAPANN
jgi:TolB-like protein